ncbi:MAG: hypothetical protein EOP58_13095 [Sphingomonadales bacterium]|nr:MAG: hypothetical protein EOP58_13095 [Sphingomonadales bacterium]
MVPDIRVDPLDASASAHVVQPVTLRFKRIGVETPPLMLTYQIVDEDSPVQMRVGMSAGPQVQWRSNDAARDIGVSRQEAYALLRSGVVSFAAGETSKDVDIRLFLTNLRDDLPAGVYRESYSLRYWCGQPDASVPNEMPGVLAVTIQVPNVLSASIAGASTRGEIDFLDFATLSRSLSISVRSTGRYTVSARSLNRHAMVREGSTSDAASDRISYDLRFGGQTLMHDGAGGVTNPRAGLQGIQIPLDVAVEDVSAKRAGRYSDTVLLTLTPAG